MDLMAALKLGARISLNEFGADEFHADHRGRSGPAGAGADAGIGGIDVLCEPGRGPIGIAVTGGSVTPAATCPRGIIRTRNGKIAKGKDAKEGKGEMLQSRTLGCVTICVTLLNLIGAPEALCQVPSKLAKPFEVVGAQRAEQYGRNPPEVQPREPTDAVLLLEFTGLTDKEWNDIKATDFYVMASQRRCDPRMKVLYTASTSAVTGVTTGKSQRKAVFVVPRAVLSLTLHIRGYAPIAFKADETIKPLLQ